MQNGKFYYENAYKYVRANLNLIIIIVINCDAVKNYMIQTIWH